MKEDDSISIRQSEHAISIQSAQALPPEVRAAFLRGDRVEAIRLLRERLDKGGAPELAPVEAALASGDSKAAARLLREAAAGTAGSSASMSASQPRPAVTHDPNLAPDQVPSRSGWGKALWIVCALVCAAGLYFIFMNYMQDDAMRNWLRDSSYHVKIIMLFFVFGLISVCMGLWKWRADEVFANHSIKTTGRVIDLKARSTSDTKNRSHTTYYSIYEFTTADGRRVVITSDTLSQESIGDTVPVLYDQARPKRAIMEREFHSGAGTAFIVGGLLFFTGVMGTLSELGMLKTITSLFGF
jgi:hypothetical protein